MKRVKDSASLFLRTLQAARHSPWIPAAAAGAGDGEEGERWRTALGFQMNERYLEWDESAARR